MAKIIRNQADAAFSDYIRARAGWQCQRCRMQFAKGKARYLHCSHNYGRGQQNIRYHPLNALALCKNCHFWFERNRVESTRWLQETLGQNYAELLRAMAHAPEPHENDLGQIAAHYRVLSYLLEPAEPVLRARPEPDKHETGQAQEQARCKRLSDTDLMERMLQSYPKLPEKQRKLYRAQILAVMRRYPPAPAAASGTGRQPSAAGNGLPIKIARI